MNFKNESDQNLEVIFHYYLSSGELEHMKAILVRMKDLKAITPYILTYIIEADNLELFKFVLGMKLNKKLWIVTKALVAFNGQPDNDSLRLLTMWLNPKTRKLGGLLYLNG